MMTPTNNDLSSITTSLTGILKGSSGVITTATAGTDFVGLASNNTLSGNNTFSGQIIVAPSSGSGVPGTWTCIGTLTTRTQLQLYPTSGTNVSTILHIMPKGTGDTGTGNLTLLNLYASDAVADAFNYSVLRAGSNTTPGYCYIASQNSGTGTLYPLIICTGNISTNQLYLSATGPVGINGSPNANTSLHVVTGAFCTNLDGIVYAGTITLDVTKGNVHKMTTTSAVGNATINASSAGVAAQEITIIITNDATAGRTITFGTNFRSSGTIVGTTSKTATIRFASDGVAWWETSRTLGL